MRSLPALWRAVPMMALLLVAPMMLAATPVPSVPRVVLPNSTTEDWPTYLHDVRRSSASGETVLAPSTIAGLTKLWSFAAGGPIVTQPIVVGGIVYAGSWDGYEYAVNGSTGALVWKTFIGQTTTPLCYPTTIGVTSSATVQSGILYAGGGDSYWYALDASTGAVLWRVYTGDNSATGGHYNWSSPLIYNGYAYIGIASNCDDPLVQGQLLQVDLSTHNIVNTLDTVPTGQVGGGIWGSPSVDLATNTIYVAVGNKNQPSQSLGQAVLALDAATLAVKASWQIPDADAVVDSDFGSTPVLFDDTSGRHWMVVPNKDGFLYAFDRTNLAAGAVWKDPIAIGGSCPDCGDGSISPVTYANGTLFAAGGNTVLQNGQGVAGAVRALNPANGAILWEHGAPGFIIPAITWVNGMILDAAGNTLEVLNAQTGARLWSFTASAGLYGAPSISNGTIFFGSLDGNLYALGLGSPVTPPADSNCPANWICQDIGAPAPAGSETVTSGAWNVSSGGAGAGGTADSFRLMAQSVTGDTQVTAQVTANAGTQSGLMARQSNAPGSPFYAVYATPGGGVAVASRTRFGGTVTVASQQYGAALPRYLELRRVGDSFQAATSIDGVNYILVPGGTVSLPLPATMLAGLMATSGTSGTAAASSFASVAIGAPSATPPAMPPPPSVCPAGWNCQDIGNPLNIGDQTLASGAWQVKGSGTDITDFTDQFHFVWQTVAGDATFSADLTAQSNTSANAKAGIMLRQSTDAGAAYYAILATPGGGFMVQYRPIGGLRVQQIPISGAIPQYIQIQRSGNVFSAFTSANGTTWTYAPGTTVNLTTSGAMLAGMAVTANNPGQLSVASFTGVTLTNSAPPPPTQCPAGWNCADIGNPTPAGTQSLNGTTWTIVAGGADIWGTADAFHYVWQTLPGDGSLSARVVSQTAASDWSKAGVMLRQTTDPGSAYYAVLVTPGHGLVVQYRVSQGAFPGQITLSVTVTLPQFIRVGRAGNTFTAYTSSDGSTWTAAANSSVTISMPGTLLAGMAAASHNTLATSTVVFDSVVQLTGCPAGWQCADIGTPAVTGGNTLINGTWTITAGGTDIFGTSDQFHYVWQAESGDGSISARVVTQVNSDVNAKAGIMFRQTTDPASAYYAIYVTPANGLAVQYRVAPGANAGQAATLVGTVPAYLKIQRAGNTFTAYTSPDGATWTAVPGSGITLQVSGAFLAGLAVTAHSATLTGGATIDSVTLNAPPPPTCPTGWQCADIGTPAVAGTQTLASGVWNVTGGGSDIWGLSDQFHYVWESVASDSTFSLHITAQANTSGYAKAGIMFRQTTDPAAPFYDVVMTPSNGIAVQYRKTQGAYTGQATTLAGTVPLLLQVARSGNAFTAYTSTNGTTWTMIPNSTVTIGTGGAFLAGMAVTAHNASALGSATFDTVSLTTPPPITCPTGWTCADIGAPAIAGAQSLSGTTWQISGGGNDIWSTSDQFHYVWQTISADNGLAVHVTAQANTSAYAKTGVMFRLTSDPAAPYYAVYVTPSNGILVQYRPTQGATARNAGSAVAGVVPAYLRILRASTTFTAYTSSDGVTWTLIPGSSTVIAALGGTVLLGLAITSHNGSKLGSATLDTVAFATPLVATHIRPHRGDANRK